MVNLNQDVIPPLAAIFGEELIRLIPGTLADILKVRVDGLMNGNPNYAWTCHPDGSRYCFHWNEDKRTTAWDDLRKSPDGFQLTLWQAGVAWEHFVKLR